MTMAVEYGRMWKQMIVTYLRVSLHLSGEA